MGSPKAPAGETVEVQPGDPDTLPPHSPDRFSWRYQLWEFQSRFHVVALDLRGYGPSDAPRDVDCYTIDLLMTDIQDVILGLGGATSLPRPCLPPPALPLPGISLIPVPLTAPAPRLFQVHPGGP